MARRVRATSRGLPSPKRLRAGRHVLVEVAWTHRAMTILENAAYSRRPNLMPMRALLRHATAGVHESLHRHPGFTGLMAGALNVSGYIALLERLYGFHSPLEHGLRAAANSDTTGQINPLTRDKAHFLRSDLLHLGVPEPEIDAIPLCGSLPALVTPEQRAGCLYVIEGAALGGAVMARGLDHLLGSRSRPGRQFLMGRPDPDPLPWPDFCRWLEVWAAHADGPAIALSAKRTFEFMEQWLRLDSSDV